MRITIQSLSKSFGANEIFSDFNMEVNPGTRLAVVGSNGTGKSTFIRMLAGEEDLDGGRVIIPREARVGYVAQELAGETLDRCLLDFVLEVLPSWTDFWSDWEAAQAAGNEAELERLSRRQVEMEAQVGHNPEHRAKTVLSGLGFEEDDFGKSLREFSGGWRERAKLARVLTEGADILLLDEPTNHLDLEAVEWLEDFLKSFEGVLVFVAHDRVFMDNVGTHVLFLGGRKPLTRKGTFSGFLAWQEEMEAQKEREAEKLQEDLRRKMDFVRRFKAKATKARQAGSKQKMAERIEKELEGLTPDVKRKTLNFRWPEPKRGDRTVLSVVDLAFTHPGRGGKPPKKLWPVLNFNLYRAEKIAVVGPNGCGKSTLLKLVMEELAPDDGYATLGPSIEPAYYSQHQLDVLDPGRTALSEIRRLSDPKLTEEELMSVLGLFMLGEKFFERQVSDLSGGEKARLLLATLFLRRANFLVLDEPTNHLDLESREALVQALEDFPGTIFFVAHDRWLLSRVAGKVWSLSRTGIEEFHSFDEYDTARRERLASSEPAALQESSDGPETLKMDRETRKRLKREQAERRNELSRKLKPLQKRYGEIEKEMEEVLARQGETEALLADPEVYADGPRAAELLKDFNALQAKSEKLFDELSELEPEIADIESRRKALSMDID